MKNALHIILTVFGLIAALVGILQSSSESASYEETRNRQLIAEEKQKAFEEDIIDSIVGQSWVSIRSLGIPSLGDKKHLQELFFTSKNEGYRKIFLSERGDTGCYFQQAFRWIARTENTGIDKRESIDLFLEKIFLAKENCGTNDEDLFKQFSKKMSPVARITLEPRYALSPIDLAGWTKLKEQSRTNETNEKIRLVKSLEYDLENALSGFHKGTRKKVISVSVDDLEVVLKPDFEKEIKIGSIVLIGEQYVFKPSVWYTSKRKCRSGVLNSIPYLDKNGKEKTGDLQFCFDGNAKEFPYQFREASY